MQCNISLRIRHIYDDTYFGYAKQAPGSGKPKSLLIDHPIYFGLNLRRQRAMRCETGKVARRQLIGAFPSIMQNETLTDHGDNGDIQGTLKELGSSECHPPWVGTATGVPPETPSGEHT